MKPIAELNRLKNLRLGAGGLVAVLAILLWSTDVWIEPTFDWLVGFFTFPAHPLVVIRRPSQLHLLAAHSRIFLPLLSLLLMTWSMWGHEPRWLLAALVLGYFLRALVWCIGGNLPLVPGDSAHHWSMANSIYLGKGPTLNYVGSFFRTYPRWGMVDDWSLPLYPYYLATAFWLVGNSVAVAKAATLLVNLGTIPALFWLAKRNCGPRVAVASALTLAVFPPHVLYASFMLKESLTMFCTVSAVDAFLWAWRSDRILLPSLVAGLAAGAMALTRNTCHAILCVMVLFALLTPTPSRWARLSAWIVMVFLIALPWGYVTYCDYGSPYYTYTNYFRYTPDWTVHFRNRGTPTLRDYLSQPLWRIVNAKCVSLYLIGVHFWFVFTPVLALGYFAQIREKWLRPLGRLSLLIFVAFVLGTLVNIASIDQVRDFGRYFPVALLPMIPLALETVLSYCDRWSAETGAGDRPPETPLDQAHREVPDQQQSHHGFFGQVVFAVLLVSCFWGSYEWTRNYSWLSDPWHQQLIRYQHVGKIIQETLPADAIVMAYHPWDLHMYCERRTVLMPHNLYPRRLREEVETYGVTHIVLHKGMGQALRPIIEEFDLPLDDNLEKDGIAVYPIRR